MIERLWFMDLLSKKIEPILRLALQLPEQLRSMDMFLSAGYNSSSLMWEVIVKYHGSLDSIMDELNLNFEILSERYAIVLLDTNNLIELANCDQIEYIEKPSLISMDLDFSLRQSCITSIQNNPPFQLTGLDTIIGIIDSGIDYTHPDFIDEDGESRIYCIWDQSIDGTPPVGFNIGTEYTHEVINQAINIQDIEERMKLLPHIDAYGHGTHVSSIAAGNGRASRGRYKGVAPEASLIIVKLGQVSDSRLTKTTEIMRAIKYIIERAEELYKPVAINISYGTNEGPHDGSTLFEVFINDISYQWKNAICVATGNEATAGHHKSGRLLSNQIEEIEFAISSNFNSLTLEIWKSNVDQFDIEIISPSGRSTGRISFEMVNQYYQLGETLVYIEFFNSTPFSENESVVIALFPRERQLDSGIWGIKIYPVSILTGVYDAWLLTTESSSRDIFFLQPDVENTATSPSTVKNVISVGGYDSQTNRISYFSGRGKNLYNDVPDIVAPAENIMAAIPGGGYDSLSGTSMAAPFITGCAALLMQWGIIRENDPYLYGQKLKACLKFGANRDRDMTYPNNVFGFGKLCLRDAFDYFL